VKIKNSEFSNFYLNFFTKIEGGPSYSITSYNNIDVGSWHVCYS